MQNLFTKITQKNTNGSINNVICNSAQKGLIPQREYFDKDIANSDNTDGYFVIKKGDFVYNPRKSVTAPYGPVSVYNNANDGIISPLYLCFRPKEAINTAFFEWYFKSSAWHRYVYLYGDSGVRHDRVNIKDSTFFEMPLHIPCDAEQKKLAHFLSLLDSLIHKQQQLVDSLKLYKRGLSIAIFDKKSLIINSTAKTITLGSFCNITMGQSPDSTSYNTEGIGLPLVQGNADMKNGITTPLKYTSNPTKTCDAGNIILSVRAPVGSVGISNQKICLGRGVCSISSTDNDYVLQYLKHCENQWRTLEQGGTFTAISGDDIKTFPLILPNDEEIESIVKLLKGLDNLISCQETLLEKMILCKQSMLQCLFI